MNKNKVSHVVVSLALFHWLVIIAANYSLYLDLHTVGNMMLWDFIFPLTFISSLWTTLYYGDISKQAIYISAVPVWLVSYIVTDSSGPVLGTHPLQLATAACVAYAIGQLLAIHLYEKIRYRVRWPFPLLLALCVGSFVDLLVFYSTVIMCSLQNALVWLNAGISDLGTRSLVYCLFVIPVCMTVRLMVWIVDFVNQDKML